MAISRWVVHKIFAKAINEVHLKNAFKVKCDFRDGRVRQGTEEPAPTSWVTLGTTPTAKEKEDHSCLHLGQIGCRSCHPQPQPRSWGHAWPGLFRMGARESGAGLRQAPMPWAGGQSSVRNGAMGMGAAATIGNEEEARTVKGENAKWLRLCRHPRGARGNLGGASLISVWAVQVGQRSSKNVWGQKLGVYQPTRHSCTALGVHPRNLIL